MMNAGKYPDDGFEVPIHRSLTEPILMMGAPRSLVYGNIFLGILLVFILGVWQVIFLNFLMHFIAVLLTKKDPQFLGVFIRYCKKKDYYHT